MLCVINVHVKYTLKIFSLSTQNGIYCPETEAKAANDFSPHRTRRPADQGVQSRLWGARNLSRGASHQDGRRKQHHFSVGDRNCETVDTRLGEASESPWEID